MASECFAMVSGMVRCGLLLCTATGQHLEQISLSLSLAVSLNVSCLFLIPRFPTMSLQTFGLLSAGIVCMGFDDESFNHLSGLTSRVMILSPATRPERPCRRGAAACASDHDASGCRCWGRRIEGCLRLISSRARSNCV